MHDCCLHLEQPNHLCCTRNANNKAGYATRAVPCPLSFPHFWSDQGYMLQGVALTDWVVNMRILDPSSPVGSEGIEVMLFGTAREQLPAVRRGGDIIRLHRLKAPADPTRPPPARPPVRPVLLSQCRSGSWGCNASRL